MTPIFWSTKQSFSLFTVLGTALFFWCVMIPQDAHASPIVRSGDTVSIAANQVLENDFYGLGGSVTISGTAKKNVYVAGGSVTTDADIKSGLTVFGGVIQVHGAVQDGVRAVGGEVTIAKPVQGDVVVLGGTLNILSTGSVSGDVLFLGGNLNIEGEVKGSVAGTAEQIRINAPVGGDVKVRATQLITLGDQADIGGSVMYTSASDLSRAQGASIKGAISKEVLPQESVLTIVRSILWKLLIVLFAGLSVFLLLRAPLERLVAQIISGYGKLGLVGFGAFIGIPFLSALLIASLLGSLVGVAFLVGYIFLIALSSVISGIVFGAFLLLLLRKKPEVTLVGSVLGTMLFSLLPFIPVIGPICMALVFFVVFGGIVLSLYHFFK